MVIESDSSILRMSQRRYCAIVTFVLLELMCEITTQLALVAMKSRIPLADDAL